MDLGKIISVGAESGFTSWALLFCGYSILSLLWVFLVFLSFSVRKVGWLGWVGCNWIRLTVVVQVV